MKIEIYTKSNCSHCNAAKALLDAHSLEYTTFSLAERGETGTQYVSREELLNRFPGARTMPQIKIDGVAIGGLTELRLHLQKQTS